MYYWMHSELNGNADGLNQVHQRVYPVKHWLAALKVKTSVKERAIELAFEGVSLLGPDAL